MEAPVQESNQVARSAARRSLMPETVLATLDTAESFVKSSPVEPMAGPTIDVARQVWSTSTATLHEVLAQV